MDYCPRIQSTSTTTVEISSSSDSSDGEVLVIDLEPRINEEAEPSPSNAENNTTVVMETSGNQEDSCVITDLVASGSNTSNNETANETQPVQDSNPVVLETSSDSECEFVLALKPPHLRTPELMSLDSASDSDVIYIPNEPPVVTRVDSSTTDSEDNKPLAETKKLLKSEDDKKPDIQGFCDAISIMPSTSRVLMNLMNNNEEIRKQDFYEDMNPMPSTSNGLMKLMTNHEDGNKVKKIYFAPKRKVISGKSIFDDSTSSSSSDSDSSDTDEEWKSTNGSGKTKARRKLTAKKLKRIRLSSSSNTKPLSQLQTSEETQHSDDNDTIKPPIKSVIIKKADNAHYIQKSKSSGDDSSE